MKNLIFAVALLVMLTGCAGMRQRQAEMRAEFERTIPHCDNEKQCTEKWRAAQVWVSRNCGMKIQIANDTLIETYNNGRANTTLLTANVVKEPIGGGKYRIIISTGCANPIGCFPDPHEAAMSFNRYVGSI